MSEVANQNEAPKEVLTPKKKKAGKVIISIIILLLLAIIGGLGYFIYTELNKEEAPKSRIASQTGYVGEFDPADLQQQADDSRFTTNMNVIWNFQNGKTESMDAYVGNLEMNSRDVYIEIVLADNPTEVIYSSPIIPRGQALTGFKLDKELAAGSYDAICTYHLVDEEENTVSELSIQVTLNIWS